MNRYYVTRKVVTFEEYWIDCESYDSDVILDKMNDELMDGVDPFSEDVSDAQWVNIVYNDGNEWHEVKIKQAADED
jgi:hypothetical protein